ncbi:hypothetical protein QOZ80_1AG0007430 [Eleusine coracana subsp. coracana]|nr:hypothetical protein QOZ80_1AG0007430 [Eleusine coracana subsp. coracana]
MCGSEHKLERSRTSSTHRCLISVGFISGALIAFLYLNVSRNFAKVPYVVITQAQRTTGKEQLIPGGEKEETSKVACHSEGRFSESCEADGDVRVNGTALSVFVVPTSSRPASERLQWEIRPYSRRTVSFIKKVAVRQLADHAAAPPCTVTYDVPAVVFAIGGLTGNYWHDYADVLVPLFVAARRFAGEVVFLVTNPGDRPRWLAKYGTLLKRLSKYDVVDLGGDVEVRCFPHVTVGLHMHKEFTILPELDTGGRLSMADFTRFQREAYGLPRDAAVSLAQEPYKKPRLMLLHRGKNRRFVNEQEIVRAADAAGFEAVVVDLKGGMPVAEQARVVNSFDALLGVHGAGLTNAAFLPAGAMLIQVVPYGKMEFIARAEFSGPATDMGLKYLDYSVTAEESTLLEMLGPEHPAVRDPDSVHSSGWLNVYEFYLKKQDLRINITRFAPTLAQAFNLLRQQ